MMKAKLMSIVSFSALVACSDDLVNVQSTVPQSANDLAIAAGFDGEAAHIVGNHLVVEGDIHLAMNKSVGRTSDSISLLWVSNQQADTGLYTIDASQVPDWAGSAAFAARSWTFGTSTGLRFVVSTSGPISGSRGTIELRTYGCLPTALACADFRRGGILGTYIGLNLAALSSEGKSSDNWKTSILAHELGHVMGFRHQDWYVNNQEPETLPGTIDNTTFVEGSGYTIFSVMMRTFQEPRLPAFWDIEAARLVYPGEAGTIYGTTSICPGQCTGGSEDDYTVETESVVPDATDSYSFQIEIERPSVSTQTISAPYLGMPTGAPASAYFTLELSLLGFPTTFVSSCTPQSAFPNGVVRFYRLSTFQAPYRAAYVRRSAPACFRID
jgi:Dual-action HEIGH metallo-peptidase